MEPAAKRARGGDSPKAGDVNGDTVGKEGVVETGAAAEADEDEDEEDDGGAGGGEGGDDAAGGGSGSEDDKKLAPSQYGANTPTGTAVRVTKLKIDGVSYCVKRIKDAKLRKEVPEGKTKPPTHVCVIC